MKDVFFEKPVYVTLTVIRGSEVKDFEVSITGTVSELKKKIWNEYIGKIDIKASFNEKNLALIVSNEDGLVLANSKNTLKGYGIFENEIIKLIDDPEDASCINDKARQAEEKGSIYNTP